MDLFEGVGGAPAPPETGDVPGSVVETPARDDTREGALQLDAWLQGYAQASGDVGDHATLEIGADGLPLGVRLATEPMDRRIRRLRAQAIADDHNARVMETRRMAHRR